MREQGLFRKALLLSSLIAVGFHSLLMGIRIEMTAFVFLPASAPTDVVPSRFGLFGFRDLAPAEQLLE